MSAVLILVPAQGVRAEAGFAPASPGCSEQFYDFMSARAQVEAEWEYEAAGALILQAKSVRTAAQNDDDLQKDWNSVRCKDFNKELFSSIIRRPFEDLRDVAGVPACPQPQIRAEKFIALLGAAGGLPDAAVTYNVQMNNVSGCAASTPILTGVQVEVNNGSYADAVCSTPGCYYDRSSNSCKEMP